MKNLAGMSVLALGVLIFLLLALAIYVFHTMPYVLAVVLLAEIVVLGAAILAPVLSGGGAKGWFGRAVFALIAVGLANSYMLFLANRWSIEPQGWYAAVLHWQDGAIRIAVGLFGFVAAFLDAVLKAVFSLGQGPISAFIDQLRAPQSLDIGGAFPGGEGRMDSLPLGMVINVLIGVVGSLWTALVLKRLLPSGAHGSARASRSGARH